MCWVVSGFHAKKDLSREAQKTLEAENKNRHAVGLGLFSTLAELVPV